MESRGRILEAARTFSSALLGGGGAVGFCQQESEEEHDSVLAPAEHGGLCLEVCCLKGKMFHADQGRFLKRGV